jgi:hypothetical protein
MPVVPLADSSQNAYVASIGPPYTWRFDASAVELWPKKTDYFILAHADQATIVNYLNGQVDETNGTDPHLYGTYLFPGLWWD